MDKKTIKGLSSNAPDLSSRLYLYIYLLLRYYKNNMRLTSEAPIGSMSTSLKFKRKNCTSNQKLIPINTTSVNVYIIKYYIQLIASFKESLYRDISTKKFK